MYDIILAAALSPYGLTSSESFIDQCCIQNTQYARTYDEKIYDARAPPSKHLAIVCCMDARLDVFRMLGLKPGEAHIIRNGKSIFFNLLRIDVLFKVVVVFVMLFVHLFVVKHYYKLKK
jgi:hypothetical protein